MFLRFSLLSFHFLIILSVFLHFDSCLCENILSAAETVDRENARGAANPTITASRVTGISREGRGAHTAGPPADLPGTSLDLVLMGVVEGGGRDSMAVILSNADKTQQLYRVGDTVAGAQIRGIRWGQVVLRVGGRDEVLDMNGAAGYRRNEAVVPVPDPVPRRLPAPLRNGNVPSAEEEPGSSLIPERVRLVLPGQEG